VCQTFSTGAFPIVSPALLIAGLVVAGHIDGRGAQAHFVFQLNTGFGTVMTTLPCPVVYSFDGSPDRSACIDPFAGVTFGVSAGVLWGRKLRFGIRADGNVINAAHGGRGGYADALVVGRWHTNQLILEGGVGVGFAAAQSQDAAREGLGGAVHVLAGLPISEHVAGVVRVASAFGGLGAVVATIGLEWSF
jgi:hypothetical protein